MTKSSTKASITKPKKKNDSAISISKRVKSSSKAQLASIKEEDLTEITISLNHYQNITPAYPSSLISAKFQYAESNFTETEKLLMTDDSKVIANQEFKIKFNPELTKDLDKLASNPVLISIQQSLNVDASTIIEESAPSEKSKVIFEEELGSIESALSLYEAFTGDVIDKEDIVKTPSLEKKLKSKKKNKEKKSRKKKGSDGKLSKKSSKDSKKSKKSGSKSSKTSKGKSSLKGTVKKSKTNVEMSDIETGVCILDLLPLFFNKSSFSDFLLLVQPELFYDDRMIRHSMKPGVQVSVSINKPLAFSCKAIVMNISVDSIYNIPSIMNEEMDYEICITVPSFDQMQQPILIKNGIYTTYSHKLIYKQWPEMKKTYSNVSNYRADHDASSIKNNVGNLDLSQVLSAEKPRISFNLIKRNVLLKEGFLGFLDQLKKYKKLVIEIHAFKKNLKAASKSSSKELKKKGKETTEETKTQPTNYLHLMAIVDLSSLLYPGLTKIRTAVPLTTFQQEEALLQGGLEKSFFYPPKPNISKLQISESAATKSDTKPKEKKSKKGSTKSKSSGSSKKSKKNKKGNKSDAGNDLNLKSKLPAEPLPEPPPEPIIKVYDDSGNPTFIVLEIELTEPLVPQRKLKDLQDNLNVIIQPKPVTPKLVIDKNLTSEISRNVIKEIINTINSEYVTYIEKKKVCSCKNAADFLTYLKRCGLYHKILLSMIQTAGFMAQFKLNITAEETLNQTQQQVVDEIFMYLITKVNETLHKTTPVSRTATQIENKNFENFLEYALEATEVGNLQLAEKYYLERIYNNENNPDIWFDYAVFNLQCFKDEKAFSCLQKALSVDLYHKNSLLVTGILLAEKGRIKDAETCLLTMMVHQTKWVEGWIVLYLFYKESDNTGGMELALEMAIKYLDDPTYLSDEFSKREDLAWTCTICPKNIYFSTACLLLKMRIYSWVEKALACELKETGAIHYLLSVICYYKENYEHALEHLDRAKFFHGSDCAVQCLLGHCYLKLGDKQKALEEYLHILESFERPDYVHLLYLNIARIMKDRRKASKLILTACKLHPTPYTWLCAGLCYLKQHDLISAEECFSEAIMLDNSIADCWGYLTLINLKLRHLSEAEICYGLAQKNKLKNEILQEEIQIEFEKLKQKEIFKADF